MRDFGGCEAEPDRTSSSVKTTSRASDDEKSGESWPRQAHRHRTIIRDEVKRGGAARRYCETSVMMADIMTKGLSGPRHKDLTTALGIRAVRGLRGAC
uniref:Uncharacterized protein n=1 Tax=Peronospora matthiolae TaxID=2874970 RepID=A0AAV1V913_9STRA